MLRNFISMHHNHLIT